MTYITHASCQILIRSMTGDRAYSVPSVAKSRRALALELTRRRFVSQDSSDVNSPVNFKSADPTAAAERGRGVTETESVRR